MPAAVTIRDIDLTDSDQVRTWFRSEHAAHKHDRPDAPFWTEGEAVHLIRPDDPEERFVPFVAEDAAGTVVGSGIVFVPLEDNLDKAYFDLNVSPAHRGHGIGDRLADHVAEVAVKEGRQVALGQGCLPVDHDESHPVRRFAARHGYTLANTEVRRVLRLPLPDETIQGWIDEAAPHHEGYQITTFVDLVPEELRPSYVDLRNQLAVDAPTGDIDFEAGAMTVAVFEEQMQRRIETGRKVYESIAVYEGRAVAHSTLSVPPGDDEMPHLNQWGTYVHRAHRGHRLGLAVKATNLRAVQRAHPERTLISTTNSPVNGPMVAINELMGFRPVDVMAEFMRRL